MSHTNWKSVKSFETGVAEGKSFPDASCHDCHIPPDTTTRLIVTRNCHKLKIQQLEQYMRHTLGQKRRGAVYAPTTHR